MNGHVKVVMELLQHVDPSNMYCISTSKESTSSTEVVHSTFDRRSAKITRRTIFAVVPPIPSCLAAMLMATASGAC
jgi:hypothetical protein